MHPSLRGLLPLLLLVGCPPHGETGGPRQVEPWVSEVGWELHPEFGSIVRVNWTQEHHCDSRVEYRFDGDAWLSTPTLLRDVGDHAQLLLGVPYDTELQLQVVTDAGAVVQRSAVQAAHTSPAPSPVLQPTLRAADPTRWESTGQWLLGSMNTTMPGWQTGEFWTFILDRQGRLVWARQTPELLFTLQVHQAADGAGILVDETTFWSLWDFDEPSMVHRMTIAGTVVDSYEIADANHPYTELPDGRLAWWGMPGEGEGELKILEADGSVTTVWSCLEFFDTLGIEGSCLGNTVSWRASDDSFLVSLALQNLVIHIDHATGATLRVFGQDEQAWSFDPPESGFWLQHGVAFTDTGTLLLSTHAGDDDETGVAREYSLDEDAQVLRQVWSYGEGLGVSAGLGGEAQRLPGGNTLHNYGTTPRVKEITPDGDVVWDADWEIERLIGHTTWLEDLYPLLGE